MSAINLIMNPLITSIDNVPQHDSDNSIGSDESEYSTESCYDDSEEELKQFLKYEYESGYRSSEDEEEYDSCRCQGCRFAALYIDDKQRDATRIAARVTRQAARRALRK